MRLLAPLGELIALTQTPTWIKGGRKGEREESGKGGEGEKGRGKREGGEGKERKGSTPNV